MRTTNYETKLWNYQSTKPDLTSEELGCLLLIDHLYLEEPEELEDFRSRYAHFDPNSMNNENQDGLIFLKIAKSNEPESVIKHRLNSYFNVKSYYIDYHKSYEENKERFGKASYYASLLIDEFLERADFPEAVKETLKETEKVRNCYDLADLLKVYKKTRSQRVKFEVLRKLGLIVLMKRIRRTHFIDDIDFAIEKIKKMLKKGLGPKKEGSRIYYYWPDENDQVEFEIDKDAALKKYEDSLRKRKALAKSIYPLQKFYSYPATTKFGKTILHTENRNKLRRNGQLEYISIVEKMLRKNLSFPSQVRDIIGVRLVVENEDIIPNFIQDLENFLGGSSTRNREKPGLNMFGKKKLSKYSSEDFYVWKAVYDVTIPHPTSMMLEKMLAITKENKEAQKKLKEHLEYLKEHPKDFIVEVQIQDIRSYLQSICRGSSSYHPYLKKRQIRDNSFYKLFPKEIYMDDLKKLKKKILKKSL